MTTPPTWWTTFTTTMTQTTPWFTPRPQQNTLVTHLHHAITTRTPTAIEAPTGIGKSYAALITAQHAPDRVIISTATRALQHQYTRDIEHLTTNGTLTCTTSTLDGRGRWLCEQRLNTTLTNPLQETAKKQLRKLKKTLKTYTGRMTRDHLPTQLPDWLWDHINADTDWCTANNCTPTTCAYLTEREKARTAQIVIVNHAVLLADAAIKNTSAVAWGRRSPGPDDTLNLAILGPYRYLIIDEAHALEAAAEAFGERRVSVRGVQTLATRAGKLPYSGTATLALTDTATDIALTTDTLPQGCLIDPTDNGPVLLDAAESARTAARSLTDNTPDTDTIASACRALATRLKAIDTALRTGSDDLGLRAVSCEKGTIISQLVNTGTWLKPHLWDQVTAILISGTLTVPGRPLYVTDRIGLPIPVTTIPSVFDYVQQRLVYITPRADTGGGARSDDTDVDELVELLTASNGRALVLFSANQDLRFVYDRISGRVPYTVLGQGVTPAPGVRNTGPSNRTVMPNNQLAERFHNDRHSVLLATRSFFEGVDFPGDTCSVVVIVRFPNLRPDDALVLARRRDIEARGGNPWTMYQEPAMQLVFRQAAGRVIRRVDDHGVVAVLDPRAGSKRYAERALRALAPSGYTMSIGDVHRFLSTPKV